MSEKKGQRLSWQSWRRRSLGALGGGFGTVVGTKYLWLSFACEASQIGGQRSYEPGAIWLVAPGGGEGSCASGGRMGISCCLNSPEVSGASGTLVSCCHATCHMQHCSPEVHGASGTCEVVENKDCSSGRFEKSGLRTTPTSQSHKRSWRWQSKGQNKAHGLGSPW